MRCLTLDEAKARLGPWLGDDGKPRRGEPDLKCTRLYVGEEPLLKLYSVTTALVDAIGPWEEAWLWLDNPDTWHRQGLHLYTRLRQSYGEHRLIPDTPVQQFHGYEYTDLCSFATIALVNEWRFAILTSHNYGRLFASRSHSIDLWTQGDDQLRTVLERVSHGETEGRADQE